MKSRYYFIIGLALAAGAVGLRFGVFVGLLIGGVGLMFTAVMLSAWDA